MNAIKEFSEFPGLEMLSSAVVLIDQHNCISYINPAAEHLFDVSRKSAKGTSLKKLFVNPSAMLIGCLLYTSPSPRDVEESRMPSSA